MDAITCCSWMISLMGKIDLHLHTSRYTNAKQVLQLWFFIYFSLPFYPPGTPIQNNVLELWSLFDFLMPGFLGTERQFQARYGRPILQSRDAKSSSREQEAGALAMEALHRQTLPFLLRRMKEDVLKDLPPKDHPGLLLWTQSTTGTVKTLYNTIDFCSSTHKRHSIARRKGRGMGYLLWVQRATYCVDL